MNSSLTSQKPLSIAELHRRLEKCVHEYQQAERLICFYLLQMKRRRGYEELGFANVEDYALELLGFSPSKTRQLLSLGRKLLALPRLTEALAKGAIGWSKASKVAMVATAEDEKEWVEKAVNLSTRQLERQIRDQLQPGGGMVKWWLTAEQSAVLARAMEICRRMCGEEVDPGRCLDLIAGEFLSTYETKMEQGLELEEGMESKGAEASESRLPVVTEDTEAMMCPDGEELPPPLDVPYGETAHGVVERDQYRCQYPGCSVMCGLHVHHIEFRSRHGQEEPGAQQLAGEPIHPLFRAPPHGTCRLDRRSGQSTGRARVAAARDTGIRLGMFPSGGCRGEFRSGRFRVPGARTSRIGRNRDPLGRTEHPAELAEQYTSALTDFST